MVKEINSLVNKILYHKRKYYEGEPEISDKKYDSLEDRLRLLDPENPVLFMIGSPEGEVIHAPVMLSCQKAKTVEEVLKWAGKKQLFMGYKVDGLSLKTVYDGGKLIQAATRGSGTKGEDVTVNAMKIAALPKTIPLERKIEVRGELYMKISEFNRINNELPEGEKYSSPRNLAVGTLKQKDIGTLEKRTLDFKAWDLIDSETEASIEEITDELQGWGFDVSDFLLIEKPDKKRLAAEFKDILDKRENLDFEIDGLVFKYSNHEDRIKAGTTDHHPKWQIALKFPGKGETTKITGITWQVGRTGVLTPVAELEPVKVAGAVIKRATLHNADFLESLGINAGDTVIVERSGDVIPRITGVITKKKERAELVEECPSCGSPVMKEGVNLVCNGKNCRYRDIKQIIYWIRITDIEGLGPKSVEKLYDEGLVKHYCDLYSVEKEELINILGKNGERIHGSINGTIELPFHLFLAAMGIEKLGRRMGKVLAGQFGTFGELQKATNSQLTAIESISDLTASYISKGVNTEENYAGLFQNGLEIIYPKEKSGSGDTKIQGEMPALKVYVTGKVTGKTKAVVKQLVEDHPRYKWSSSISKNLDYLVVGEKAGEKKLEKAASKGIKTITWDEFNELMRNEKPDK